MPWDKQQPHLLIYSILLQKPIEIIQIFNYDPKSRSQAKSSPGTLDWDVSSLSTHRNRQGNEQTRTFEPTNESEDCWSAAHSYNFIIRVK